MVTGSICRYCLFIGTIYFYTAFWVNTWVVLIRTEMAFAILTDVLASRTFWCGTFLSICGWECVYWTCFALAIIVDEFPLVWTWCENTLVLLWFVLNHFRWTLFTCKSCSYFMITRAFFVLAFFKTFIWISHHIRTTILTHWFSIYLNYLFICLTFKFSASCIIKRFLELSSRTFHTFSPFGQVLIILTFLLFAWLVIIYSPNFVILTKLTFCIFRNILTLILACRYNTSNFERVCDRIWGTLNTLPSFLFIYITFIAAVLLLTFHVIYLTLPLVRSTIFTFIRII